VISTPLKEVFEKRHGVCQDFAHVMIAGCAASGCRRPMSAAICAPSRRRANRACRARTPPTPGSRCGAASEIGWVGFDPTNDLLVENDHIVLAVGRDFSDVSPVDGIIVGSRKQKLAWPWMCCWWTGLPDPGSGRVGAYACWPCGQSGQRRRACLGPVRQSDLQRSHHHGVDGARQAVPSRRHRGQREG
jgi:hypothetical protein